MRLTQTERIVLADIKENGGIVEPARDRLAAQAARLLLSDRELCRSICTLVEIGAVELPRIPGWDYNENRSEA